MTHRRCVGMALRPRANDKIENLEPIYLRILSEATLMDKELFLV